jgi:hypothetical protein
VSHEWAIVLEAPQEDLTVTTKLPTSTSYTDDKDTRWF